MWPSQKNKLKNITYAAAYYIILITNTGTAIIWEIAFTAGEDAEFHGTASNSVSSVG